MGHKIFVSYKYSDSNVRNISGEMYSVDTVRTYVNKLADYISKSSEHIYKGEDDGEDLSHLSDDQIWEKLKDRIYDSTLTIIMISPGMRETYKKDRDQWIPWEISYSLKEVSRKNISGNMVSSFSNAILAIVLPDRLGNYDYYTYNNKCCSVQCRALKTYTLFEIVRSNMFNIKNPDIDECRGHSKIYHGDSSYILSVKWDDFVEDPESYIQKAYDIQSKIDQYDITKEV